MMDDLRMPEEAQEMMTAARHEKEMTRMEIINRRWFIAFLVVLFMLFGTNMAWVIYENQFQDVVVTTTAESQGEGNATAFGTGDWYNGESEQHD